MIRVGFLQDISEDNEAEQRMALRELAREVGGEYGVVWAGDGLAFAKIPDVDLLLVDYGGLHASYSGAWDTYGHEVKRWADEHPGKPVLLWSAFTAACYSASFEGFEREAGNVMSRYAGAWDFDGYPDLWDRLRSWLGVPPWGMP